MNGSAPTSRTGNGTTGQGPPRHPQVAVGVVVLKEERVLLVRRRNPPSQGKWALPGGKVEFGETLQAAAEREILEETGVVVEAGEPVFTFDLIRRDPTGAVLYHYLIVDLVARYVAGQPAAGDDALEARWVAAEELAGMAVSQGTLTLLAERFDFS